MIDNHLKCLRREQIDLDRWDDVVQNAVQSRIYGHSWYLDMLTNQSWSALMIGDYDVVFPMVAKTKYGIPYVTNPYLCQQLGMFSKVGITDQQCDAIISYLKTHFLKADILINNHFTPSKHLTAKNNHILDLRRNYLSIYTDYNTNTKRNLKKANAHGLKVEKCTDLTSFMDFVLKNDKSMVLGGISGPIKSLLEKSINLYIGDIYITKVGDEIIAGVFAIKGENRVYTLIMASNQMGITQNAMFLIIDHIIQEYAETNMLIDFTGSNIPNVARRNESFGATIETYFHLKTYWNPL